jgi:hypothetical protein
MGTKPHNARQNAFGRPPDDARVFWLRADSCWPKRDPDTEGYLLERLLRELYPLGGFTIHPAETVRQTIDCQRATYPAWKHMTWAATADPENPYVHIVAARPAAASA